MTWSNVENRNFSNPASVPELTGYIKDMAWSYEKEIRIKAEFNNTNGIERVAIPLSEEVLGSIRITAGPLYEGDIEHDIKRETRGSFDTDTSLFWKKLRIKTNCSECPGRASVGYAG